MPKYEVPSAQQELVSQGTAKGFQGLVEPVFAALKAKEEKKQADTDLETKRAHEVLVAAIRSGKTEKELLMEDLRYKDLESRINERGGNKGDEEVDYGNLDESTSMDATEVPEGNLPENQMWNLGMPPETEDVLNPLSSLVPTQQDVQALLSKPLSALTANVDIQKQAGALADMQAGNLTPTGASMSTDTQAPEKPASFNILSKNKSLVTPEEARKIQEEFYATTRELPTGFGALSTLPKPEQQQVLAEPKVDEQDLNRYFRTWGDPNVAIKAQKKIAEILGPEYNEAKIEQIKTKKGETGFKVLFPERKTDKELAEASKKPEKFKLLQAHLEKFNNIDSAEATLKDIQGVLSEVGNQSGPMVGRIRQLIGGVGYDSLAIRLNNLVDSLTPGLARGVFGEVGVLTDDDVRRYKALIPNIQRDPKVAQILMDDLLNTLKTRKKITIGNLDKAGYDIENFKVTEEVPESENLMDSARQLVGQIKQMPEGSDKEALKAQLREIQIKLKK
jgi:hypothetical protein